MNLEEIIKKAESQLRAADIGTPHLDVLVLLEDITKLNRAWLLSHPEHQLTKEQQDRFQKVLHQRSKHLPLAYIRGVTEFYGRNFIIDQRVLEPRPESEAIIEELRSINDQFPIAKVLDVGTGSGALIITAKLELPGIEAYATDISQACLAVSRLNVQKHKVSIKLFHGNLVQPVPQSVWQSGTVIIANLPYVPETWQINPAAQREPQIAIFGGKDGLKLYRRLFKQLQAINTKPAFVLTESMPPQHELLTQIAARAAYKPTKTNDFVQVFSYSAQHQASL